jgi:hypothetical protein
MSQDYYKWTVTTQKVRVALTISIFNKIKLGNIPTKSTWQATTMYSHIVDIESQFRLRHFPMIFQVNAKLCSQRDKFIKSTHRIS